MEGSKEFRAKTWTAPLRKACGYFNTARKSWRLKSCRTPSPAFSASWERARPKVRARRAPSARAVESILGKKALPPPTKGVRRRGSAYREKERPAGTPPARAGAEPGRGRKNAASIAAESLVPARRRAAPSPARLPLGKWKRRPRPRRHPFRTGAGSGARADVARLGTRIVLKAKARSGKPRAPQVTSPRSTRRRAANPAALPGVPGPGARKTALEGRNARRGTGSVWEDLDEAGEGLPVTPVEQLDAVRLEALVQEAVRELVRPLWVQVCLDVKVGEGPGAGLWTATRTPACLSGVRPDPGGFAVSGVARCVAGYECRRACAAGRREYRRRQDEKLRNGPGPG